eukprot:CAMPEP_0183355476 /NCGR_PEP_ID=MMETSP0164_2-20130417/40548_1 /TAXON_ID=221442 /ORGANISM="Coccolithus pelagicus ssp braarudi, Strain PLY182g" /LENGTH=64 /DNA_ID=CAMNT_0025528601 /DNA_START=108 /DNA_END=302 /DNA_ORIENTATION=+
MLHTLLKYSPLSDNAKVAAGVGLIISIGAIPMFTRKGKGYDSMAEKREDQEKRRKALEQQKALP